MSNFSDQQRAAVRRVLDWTRPTLTASEVNDLTVVLNLLPPDLKHPVLPAERGLYLDRRNDVWRNFGDDTWMRLIDKSGDAEAFAPFRSLAVEKPSVTPQALDRVVLAADGGRMSATVRRAILDFINEGRS